MPFRSGPPRPVFGPIRGPGRPGGIGGPGRIGRPGGVGGIGGRAQSPGLGGLGSLARSRAIAGKSSTVAVNRQTLANQGNQVRNNYNRYHYFHGNWWRQHPRAWRAARWATAAAVYRTATWAACSRYCGYAAEPVYYDYGSNVVYDDDNVYVNGDEVATQEEYAQQAMTIADTGKPGRATKKEKWLSLGVFAMIQGKQANGNDLFQLAVNKSGVIRGNYYHAVSDTTLPVYGSVDKKTQRAAWTIGKRKKPIFEAGFANLTRSETTMLVHFGKGRTQQWTLVRIAQSAKQK
jgi:hypothetical protein